MTAAVNQYGRPLQFASEDLRTDREIVIAAVKEYGDALEFKSKYLNRYSYILMAEVNQDGLIFIHVYNNIQGDR